MRPLDLQWGRALCAIVAGTSLMAAAAGLARAGPAPLGLMSPGYSACASKAALDELMEAIRQGDEPTALLVQSRECHVFPNCERVEVLRHDGTAIQVKVRYSDYPLWTSEQALVETCP